MKTERRHELQKNELADVLGKEITAIKPYWKAIVGGVVAVIAVGIALIAYSQSQKFDQQKQWKNFLDAQSKATVDRDTDALSNVARDSAGTPVSSIAELLAADRELGEGIRQLYVNRKEADEHLKKASEGYQRAATTATAAQQEVKMRALLGQASAEESLREIDKAGATLKEAEKTAPNTVLGKEATRRLEMLAKNKDWYEWFKDQAPIAPHPMPSAGGNSVFQPGLGNVPDSPDIKFNVTPSTTPGEKPLGPDLPPKAGESAAPVEPAKPAESDAEKPGEAKPEGDAKPAEEAKPEGDAKPAADAKPEEPAKPAAPEAAPPANPEAAK